MKKTLAYLLGTFFGVGYTPKAPGTAGSLVTVPIAFFILSFGKIPLLIFVIITFIAGLWASSVISADKSADDPQIVVMDEVHGQSIAMLLIPAQFASLSSIEGWVLAFISFGFFRLFDIWKPFPAGYFDKKVHNAYGMMLDDTCAALYAMIMTLLATLFFS